MKRISEATGVSRSQLMVRVQEEKPPKKRTRYNKGEDQALLPLIVAIMHDRPTYGYRRMCALLNRELVKQGKETVNHKRVYRIMKLNNLLLARYTGLAAAKAHNGRVSTDTSNTRWCSDGFEFLCDDGQRVRVVFALDTCDREVISFIATTGGITSQHVQDLMLECVEKRFKGHLSAPTTVEWLNDNGSCYTAHETREFAKMLNLDLCYTPVRSPESNGMSEAFVKTFKRDYVYVHERHSASETIEQLHEWINDYNESAPHKALGMLSPREFIRRQKLFSAELQDVEVTGLPMPQSRGQQTAMTSPVKGA